MCALRTTFSHDGGRVIAGDWSGQILVWNTADGKRVGTLSANPPSVAEQLAQAVKELESRQKARVQLAATAAASQKAAQQAAADLAAARKAVVDTAAAAKVVATRQAALKAATMKAAADQAALNQATAALPFAKAAVEKWQAAQASTRSTRK